MIGNFKDETGTKPDDPNAQYIEAVIFFLNDRYEHFSNEPIMFFFGKVRRLPPASTVPNAPTIPAKPTAATAA